MRKPVDARTALLVFLLLGPSVAEGAQSSELPTVRLIGTGGTISSRQGSRLSAAELVGLVPSLDQYVQAETEQFTNLPSSELAVNDWLALAQRVNRLLDERPALAGVVVANGTDTLEETAYFLHLTVRHTRPVVVVGSMRPPDSLGYDGAANLLQAFRVAADPASRGRGVLVVLNAEVNSAREVTKTNAERLQTFGTRGYGVLGVVDADRVVYYRRTDRRHTIQSEFDVSTIQALPRVDILLAYQGAPGDLIQAAADAGAAGLVLAGTGAGATSPSQRDAVRVVLKRGLTVVLTSRTGGGRVVPRPALHARPNSEPGTDTRRPPSPVTGEDLSPIKARILLMLALTQTRDGREIQRMFEEY